MRLDHCPTPHRSAKKIPIASRPQPSQGAKYNFGVDLSDAIAKKVAIGELIKQGREHLCKPEKFSDEASPIDSQRLIPAAVMLENDMFVSRQRLALTCRSDSASFHDNFGARKGLDTMFHSQDGCDRLIMAVLPKTLEIGKTTRVGDINAAKWAGTEVSRAPESAKTVAMQKLPVTRDLTDAHGLMKL